MMMMIMMMTMMTITTQVDLYNLYRHSLHHSLHINQIFSNLAPTAAFKKCNFKFKILFNIHVDFFANFNFSESQNIAADNHWQSIQPSITRVIQSINSTMHSNRWCIHKKQPISWSQFFLANYMLPYIYSVDRKSSDTPLPYRSGSIAQN